MSATVRTTITTSTTSESDTVKLPLIAINKKYILTLTGILKLIELVRIQLLIINLFVNRKYYNYTYFKLI